MQKKYEAEKERNPDDWYLNMCGIDGLPNMVLAIAALSLGGLTGIAALIAGAEIARRNKKRMNALKSHWGVSFAPGFTRDEEVRSRIGLHVTF